MVDPDGPADPLVATHGAFKCLRPCKSVGRPLSKPRKAFTIGLKINEQPRVADWDQSQNQNQWIKVDRAPELNESNGNAVSLLLTGGYAAAS